MTVYEQIQGKSLAEKAEIKSQEISKLDLVGEYTDPTYGVRVEIKSFSKIAGGIEVLVKAWRKSKQLGFGVDGSVEIERIRIHNPPILIPDGTLRAITFQGEQVEIPNFVEDLGGAMRLHIAKVVHRI